MLARLLFILLAVYLAFCLAIYFAQTSMLFPAHLTPPVGADWKPAMGNASEQALLDGRCGKLHAVFWKNTGDQAALMFFHGNGESVASVEALVPAYQALGYGVMTWDYPGYGRSADCAFSEDDLLHDADLAYRWLASRVSGKPIVLFGRSVGAGLALHVASRHPHHPVLLVSPYDSLVNVAGDHMPFFVPVRLLLRYPLRAERWISQIQGPVHAIHGLDDTLIAPERAAALLRRANKHADMEWVEGAGHNDSILLEKSYRWLARHSQPIQGNPSNE